MVLAPPPSPLAGAVAGGSTAKSRIHAPRFPIAIDSPPRARAATVHKPIRATSGTTGRLECAFRIFPPVLRGLRAFPSGTIGRSQPSLAPLKSPLKSFDHAACVHILGPARW